MGLQSDKRSKYVFLKVSKDHKLTSFGYSGIRNQIFRDAFEESESRRLSWEFFFLQYTILEFNSVTYRSLTMQRGG